MMLHFAKNIGAIVALGLSVSSLQAATFDYQLSPADLTDQASATPSTKFAYDWDQAAPDGSSVTGAPGWGGSSFYSNVNGSADPAPGKDYTALRIFPSAMQQASALTVGDIADMSWWTKNTDTNLIDWQIKIYTVDETNTKWYKTRINLKRGDAVDNDWHQWQASTRGVDSIFDKIANTYLSINAANDEWSDVIGIYGGEKVLFIDVIAGFATNSPAVESYVDGIKVNLSNGDVANIDLVPEPSSMILIGLGSLLAFKSRRR